MKNIYKLLGVSALAFLGLSSLLHAEETKYTIDFESYLNTDDQTVVFEPLESLERGNSTGYDPSLHHITDQYAYQFGLNIYAKSVVKDSAGNKVWSDEEAWLFDTNDAVAKTPTETRGVGGRNDGDSDLASGGYETADGFDPDKDFGNVLIVQEDPVDFAFPDDEATDSTRIYLEWDKPVLFNDLTVLDIEGDQDFKVVIFGIDGTTKERKYASGLGNHSYEQLTFSGQLLTERVKLIFEDSGAIGEFSFTVDSVNVVPEPATLAFLAIASLGFIAYRRRKS